VFFVLSVGMSCFVYKVSLLIVINKNPLLEPTTDLILNVYCGNVSTSGN